MPKRNIHSRTIPIAAMDRTGSMLVERAGLPEVVEPILIQCLTRPSTSAPARHRAILLAKIGDCDHGAQGVHPLYAELADFRLEMN